jgi:hypothetical protein
MDKSSSQDMELFKRGIEVGKHPDEAWGSTVGWGI